jgi:hypothetical protein
LIAWAAAPSSCAATCATAPAWPLEDDDLLVVAPHGLDDLLNGICRHNPTRVSARFYAERQASKRWSDRWPRVRYLDHA